MQKISNGFWDKFSPLLVSLDILSRKSTIFILCRKQKLLEFSDFLGMGEVTFVQRVKILYNFPIEISNFKLLYNPNAKICWVPT